MRVPADFVELSASLRVDGHDRDVTLRVRLGDGAPQLTGGIGGWDAVSRPGRRPLTVWRGPEDPLTLSLPVLFDGYGDAAAVRVGEEGSSVEPEIRLLEKMAGLDRGDPEPPTVSVEGSLPHDESRTNGGNRWVVTDIEWGDAIRRRSDGHRIRQAATVTLWLHTEDDRLSRVQTGKKPTYRYVTARSGDTWEKVAARELKLKRAGNRLARLNGKRDGSAKIKAKTRVRLPSATALKDWRHDLGGR